MPWFPSALSMSPPFRRRLLRPTSRSPYQPRSDGAARVAPLPAARSAATAPTMYLHFIFESPFRSWRRDFRRLFLIREIQREKGYGLFPGMTFEINLHIVDGTL